MKNKILVLWAVIITALTISTFFISFNNLNGWMMLGMEKYKTAAQAIGSSIGVIVIVTGIAVAFVGVIGATAGLSAIVALGIMAIVFTAFGGFMGGFAIAIALIIGWVGVYIVYSTITDDKNKSSIMFFNVIEMIVIAGVLAVMIFNY